MRIKRLTFLSLCFIIGVVSVAGCGSGGGENSRSDLSGGEGLSVSDSFFTSGEGASGEEGKYAYDGVATIAPYVIYNADDTVCEDAQVGGNSFDSMFEAIKTCGKVASSKNKAYVKDSKGTLVFQRQGNTQCWVYDGTHIVSNAMTPVEGKTYADEHPRAYVVNGQGTAYVALGSIRYQYTDIKPPEGELFSGGYTYLYSPWGCASGSEWSGHSYAYMSAYVRLSEVTYKDASETGEGGFWNAYVFFNIMNSGTGCDIGLGTYGGDGGKWKITQNCGHSSHGNGTATCEGFYIDAEGNVTHDEAYADIASSNSFMVWGNYVVSSMTKDENGVYSGADDVFMEAYAHENGLYLCVTNLRTNEKWGYTHTHEGMNTSDWDYMKVFLAASYCPVDGNLWNARDGGFLKNVVFEDVMVAKYRADGNYDEAEKEPFYIGNDTLLNGSTTAADCASLLYGTTDVVGTWKSGKDKIVGSHWFAFSSYYDGTHIE